MSDVWITFCIRCGRQECQRASRHLAPASCFGCPDCPVRKVPVRFGNRLPDGRIDFYTHVTLEAVPIGVTRVEPHYAPDRQQDEIHKRIESLTDQRTRNELIATL